MADQKRWFKVWTSIGQDPSFLSLPVESLGRWVLLGAWMASHGNKGVLVASEQAIRHTLRLPESVTVACGISLPNVQFEEGTKRDGKFTVTMQNWHKYQEDSTGSQRMKTLRSKRRGEERRREESEEGVPKNVTPSSTGVWNPPVADVHERLDSLHAPEQLHDQTYWLRIHEWVEGTKLPVYYLDELKAYLAWHAAQNGAKRHKDLKRGYRNWLSTALRMRERDAQRTHQHTQQ